MLVRTYALFCHFDRLSAPFRRSAETCFLWNLDGYSQIMNAEIRSLFPALERFAYLNSAAVAPLPTTAIEAINVQLRDVSNFGSSQYPEWVDTKERCRSLVAEMLGTREDQIAFIRNTSDGF